MCLRVFIVYRIPEKEIMDDIEQAINFDNAQRKYSEDAFVLWYKEFCNIQSGTIVDLGSGPAKYLIRMSNEFPNTNYIGYDASDAMIQLARSNINAAGLSERITIKKSLFKNIQEQAECVISSGTLHHAHDPIEFWTAIKRMNPKHIFVMDLIRPKFREQAEDVVNKFAKTENNSFRTDFYNSLCAAFTADEMKSQLEQVGLSLSVNIKGEPDYVQIAIIHGKL